MREIDSRKFYEFCNSVDACCECDYDITSERNECMVAYYYDEGVSDFLEALMNTVRITLDEKTKEEIKKIAENLACGRTFQDTKEDIR